MPRLPRPSTVLLLADNRRMLGKLLVVAREDSPESVRLSIEVGSRFVAKHTASGRLLLDAGVESVAARDETIEGVDDAVVRIGKRVRLRQKLVSAEPKSGGMQLTNECTIEIEGDPRPALAAPSAVWLLAGWWMMDVVEDGGRG